MQFNARLTLLAVLAATATFVAAADNDTVTNNGTVLDPPSTNGTETATNGTTPATNGTATNGTAPATNGTATNGTAVNGTEPATPEPSSGSTAGRRSLAACEYGCPADDASSPFLLATSGGDTFTCTYESGVCTYQTETGVLNADENGGKCRAGAVPLVAGCAAGAATNGGVLKRRGHKHRRSSREMQYEAIARRFLL